MKITGGNIKPGSRLENKRSQFRSPSLFIETLEPRLLYSADLLAGAVELTSLEPGVQEDTQTRLSILARVDSQGASVNNSSALLSAEEEREQNPEVVLANHESSRVELIIIDTSTEDYQLFVDDIINNAADGVFFEFALIEQQHNGVEQISDILAQYQDLDALHLISHGDEGVLNLGNTPLSMANLDQYAPDISRWCEVFSPGGDILLYGCNLAAGSEGELFVDALAALTLSDIAASDDLTGFAGLGGDWQLEYHSGSIETQLAVSEPVQEQWKLLLANDSASANDDAVTYASYINSLSPISHWLLDESSGTLALDQAGSNNGTYVNGPGLAQAGALVDDPANTAVSFDGTTNNDSGDYIVIPHDASMMLDDGAIQLWFNTDNVMQDSSLFSKDSLGYVNGGHVEIDLTASGHINVRLQSNTDSYFVETTQVMTNSQWHNVVFTFGSGGMKLYVDGELADTNVYTGGLGTSSGGSGNSEPIVIGASTGVSNSGLETPTERHYQGKIDEVALLGSALTAEQIKILHGSGLQDYTLLEDGSLNVSADAGVLANDYDAEGDSLTAILVSGPSNADTFTLNGDGSFDYTPTANFSGSDSFTYKANDGTSDSNIATVTLTVTGVDDQSATAVNQSMTVLEGAANSALNLSHLQSTDPDTDDNTLIYTLGDVSNGSLSINGSAWASGSNDTFTQQDIINGNILYSHNGSNTTADNFSYSVDDGAGNLLTGQTFTITVTPVDSDIATVVNQSMTVAEGDSNTALSLTELQSTDTDSDDNTLIYTVTDVSHGTLYINGSAWYKSGIGANDTFTQQDIINGNILYSHDGSNTISDGFSYSVADLAGNQLSGQTFALTVTAVDDDTATVVNQSMTVLEGASNITLSLTELQSSDADSSDVTLLYTVGDVTNGILTINGSAWASGTNDSFTQQDIIDGNILYSHDDSNTTSDSFSYSVEDAVGNQLSGQTFAITVTPVDEETATVISQSITVNEGATNVTLTLTELQSTDVDTDDNTLIYTVGNVSNGTLTINGSVWASGSNDTFTQQDIIDGKVLYSHDGSNTLVDSFSYTVQDGAGNKLSGETFAITVTAVDDETAAAVNQSMTVDEGASNVTLTLNDLQSTDIDSDDTSLIYTVTDVSHGTLYINGSAWYKSGIGANDTFTQQDIIDGKVLYSHDGSNTLSDSFDYIVEDGGGNQLAGQTFAITVNPVDEDPATVINQSMTVEEGQTDISLTLAHLQSSDTETSDNTLVYIVTNVGHGSLLINGNAWVAGSNDRFTQQDIIDGKLVYSHDGSNTLTDNFIYSVEDGAGNRLTGQTFAIAVTPVDDDIAVVINLALMVTEGDNNIVLSIDELQSTDADSDDSHLLYTVSNVSNGTLTINGSAWALGTNDSFTQQDILDGKVLYSHNGTNTNSDSFNFSVVDPAGNELGDQTFTIKVNRIDDDPALITGDLSFSGNEGDLITGVLSASDVDGLTDGSIFSTGQGFYGSVDMDPVTGVWLFTPTDSNWFGSDSFTVTVTDDLGGMTEQLVTIALTGIDDAALISGDLYYIGSEGDQVAGNIIASDVEGLTDQTYFTVGVASHGLVEIDEQSGYWSYTAKDSNWFGSDSFTVTVTDDLGGTTTELIRIELADFNHAAIISGEAAVSLFSDPGVSDESATSGQFTITDLDAGEDRFIAETITGRYGELEIDSQGHWSYRVDNNQETIRSLGENESVTDLLTVSSIDGTKQQVKVTINSVDGAPVIPGSLSTQPLAVNAPLAVSATLENTEQASIGKEAEEEAELAQENESAEEEAQTSKGNKVETIMETSNEKLTPVSLKQINHMQHNRHETGSFSVIPFETVVAEINEVTSTEKELELKEVNQEVKTLALLDLIQINFSEQTPLELLTDEQISARDNDHFFRELDQMRRELNESVAEEELETDVVAEVTMGATLSFSVGVLAWVLRGGSLMASFLSVIPLWKQFDLMPVLGNQAGKPEQSLQEGETEEALALEESIFDSQEQDKQAK